MNFPVVAGGFALITAVGGTQAVVGAAVAGTSIFSTSFTGGAAGLLGIS